jgi:PKD repeat protein
MRLPHAAMARVAAAAVLAGAAGAGSAAGCSCGDGGQTGDAGPGGDGGGSRDAAALSDATTPLIWVDFTVTGCEAAGESIRGPGGGDAGPGEPDGGGGPDTAACTGDAPLALAFVPIAPSTVDLHEWNFGDGSEPDRRASPDHVYAAPGVYDVSLFAQGPGGTAAISKSGLVLVRPGPIGNACSDDAQCASGSCVCGAQPCAGLATGLCSAACSVADPCQEGVCADLAPTGPADPEPWQASLCLADCSEAACSDGLVCRELRRGDGAGWTRGCFAPGLFGDIGDPCADESGDLQDELCASGQCLARGLRGVCSAGCASQACPPSAACATFNGGAPAPSCLARCDGDTACDGDPWLACEAAGGAGGQGFTVDETPSRGGYCAPESCDGPEDCPLGECTAGFCGP